MGDPKTSADKPTFELKPLTEAGVPAALEKAVRYRLLNEPWDAESIARDVLRVDPDHHDALVTLILSMTDQLGHHPGPRADDIRALLPRFKADYDKAYYGGIICERRARCLLERGAPGSGSMAYALYRQAMAQFDKAAEMRPDDDSASRLRWNTCARAIMRHPHVKPAATDETEFFLE